MQSEAPNVLLIEDNEDHAELVTRSLKNHSRNCNIFHVTDGSQAIDFIFRRHDYVNPEKSPTPDLVLLDLRMPKIDGIEVLQKIKKEKEYSSIPVVILTTSNARQDIEVSYKYHTNSYLVKPVDYDKFNSLMKDIASYWLNWNRHPNSIDP